MNRIEDMIREMCPEGVERVKLGNVMNLMKCLSPTNSLPQMPRFGR